MSRGSTTTSTSAHSATSVCSCLHPVVFFSLVPHTHITPHAYDTQTQQQTLGSLAGARDPHQHQHQHQHSVRFSRGRALKLAFSWGLGAVGGLPSKIRQAFPKFGMAATEDALFRSIEGMQKSAKKPWWGGLVARGTVSYHMTIINRFCVQQRRLTFPWGRNKKSLRCMIRAYKTSTVNDLSETND